MEHEVAVIDDVIVPVEDGFGHEAVEFVGVPLLDDVLADEVHCGNYLTKDAVHAGGLAQLVRDVFASQLAFNQGLELQRALFGQTLLQLRLAQNALDLAVQGDARPVRLVNQQKQLTLENQVHLADHLVLQVHSVHLTCTRVHSTLQFCMVVVLPFKIFRHYFEYQVLNHFKHYILFGFAFRLQFHVL